MLSESVNTAEGRGSPSVRRAPYSLLVSVGNPEEGLTAAANFRGWQGQAEPSLD